MQNCLSEEMGNKEKQDRRVREPASATQGTNSLPPAAPPGWLPAIPTRRPHGGNGSPGLGVFHAAPSELCAHGTLTMKICYWRQDEDPLRSSQILTGKLSGAGSVTGGPITEESCH